MRKASIVSLALLPVLALLQACSSAPTSKDIAKDEAAAAAVRAQADADKMAKEQKQAERHMDVVPSWALAPPRPDAEGFYAVGMSESSKMDLALKKATLQAEFQLAKAYKAVISGNERQFQRDQGGRGGVSERYTQLIDQLVDRVPLGGYEVVKREVKTLDGQYHSFVLLRLSYEQFNKVLASEKKAKADASIDEQFAELESRLDKYKTERRQEALDAEAARERRATAVASVGKVKAATLGADDSVQSNVVGGAAKQ